MSNDNLVIDGTIVEAEMTFEEIAEVLGITPQGVRAIYCKAIKKLAKRAELMGLAVYIS